MLANLDALLTALYVRVDDLLPKRRGPGHPPRISDAELIALAVAGVSCQLSKRASALSDRLVQAAPLRAPVDDVIE